MAFFSVPHITIKGLSAAVPRNEQSNFDLKDYTSEDLEKLISTIGIEKRRVAEQPLCASDLCVASAEKLIEKLNWKKAEIDVVFFVSQTPDYLLPGTSLHLIERLGLPKSCISFDINQGCAGYVYGLSLITSFMSASEFKKGLLLVGDTITKLISETDKSLKPIFSDCGTATALERKEEAIMNFNISSEGQDYEAIIVKEGGARNPYSKVDTNDLHLSMKGLDVFNFSIKKVVPNVHELLVNAKLSTSEIDYFVFHQANKLILDSMQTKLTIGKEKVPSSLKLFGNTSGASIPLTIVTNLGAAGKIKNARMVLSGFGVGLSLASAVVSFEEVVCNDLIEM
jgi:3-oxoacyl-[acyl-carrier-protein] synthase III